MEKFRMGYVFVIIAIILLVVIQSTCSLALMAIIAGIPPENSGIITR